MKLRRRWIYLGCGISLVLLFTCCYYFSYQSALSHFNQRSVERSNDLVSYLSEITIANKKERLNGQDTDPVDTTSEARVSSDTVYELEIYDVKTNTTSVTTLNPPAKYIGLNREELVSVLDEEMQDIPLSEYQKGLISFVVKSFSEDKIVLRKSYNPDLIQFKYYIAIRDGKILVYYSDKKTLFDNTEINASHLSEKIQAELSAGKYVRDEDELYSLLESYSS